MISNDEGDGQHFLDWVNIQRNQMGENIPWYSLQQLKQDQFLETILYKLDHQYFSQLMNLPFNYSVFVTKIQQYLDKFLGQKIKRNLRNQMVAQQSPIHLLRIVFYICVQSPIKSQFIHRVFELSNESQGHLMHSLKNMQENIQNIIEVKEILKRLEEIEQQNEELKIKLKQKDNQTLLLRELVKESEEQIKKVSGERNQLKKEKDQILGELGISEVRQYIRIYKDLQTQNQEILESLRSLSKQNQDLDEQRRELKDKINQDNLVIEHLNEQITKLKANYHSIWLEMSYHQDKNQETPLKENKTISNLRNRKSFQKNPRIITSPSLQDQDLEEHDKIRQYNSELMRKLQQMYKKINTMTQQLTILQEENQKLTAQNTFNTELISNIQKAHQQFVQSYSLTL